MADILQVEASVLKSTIERMRRLYPELDDDAELLADMVDGSTNFDAVMDRLALAFITATSLKEANASVQKALRERGDRLDRRADAVKALMMDLMLSAGKRKIELPTATAFFSKGRPKLVIDDEGEIPQGYIKTERIPMRADIAAALSAGDQIPGARLEAAPEHLSVRTK